jgi:hypothetical protein
MYSVAIDEFVVPRFAAFHLRFSTN